MFCSFTPRLLFLLPDFSDTFLLSPPPPILSLGLVNRVQHILLHFIELGQSQLDQIYGLGLEHKTCDILAAERLRLMIFDHRLIIESFQKAIYVNSNGNFGRVFYIIQHCLRVNIVATCRANDQLWLWQKEKVVCCSRVWKGKTSILKQRVYKIF